MPAPRTRRPRMVATLLSLFAPFTLFALALGPMEGCKTASPPDAALAQTAASSAPPAGPVWPVWTVRGRTFSPQSAALLWRARANDALLVVSDAPNICELLSAGAWPQGATMLRALLKHNARDLQDAPWGEGVYPLRDPTASRATRAPRDAKGVAFQVLGDDCSPDLILRPTAGSVQLHGPAAVPGELVHATLDLRFGADQVTGRVDAVVCRQPKEYPRGCR